MLIGITGYARHGKDSAANRLVEKFGFTKLGFADAVREVAQAIDPYVSTGQDRHFTEGATPFARYRDTLQAVGYETAKSYPDVRRLLQRIGTEGGRGVLGPNVWVAALHYKLKALGEHADVVINDVRFENEAELIRSRGGFLLRVVRPNFENGLSLLHPSESAIATLDVDYEIEAEAFDDLLEQTERAYEDLLLRGPQFAQFEEDHLGVEPVKPLVYLAAPWKYKSEAGEAKAALIAAGIDVISGWTERENTPAEIDATTMAEQARLDRDEVYACNTLVVLNLDYSDGKATEMGMALALGKRVILVGPKHRNIFYHLPEVERVDTLDEAIALLVPGYTVTIHSVSNIAENGVEPRKLGVLTDVKA